MIPGSFDYHRPASIPAAVALLGSLGEDARPLAGGHSIIPMMKTRLAMPAHLVDLRGIPELRRISQDGEAVVIGAMVTQHEMLGSALLAERLPIIGETAAGIADPQIRYMGTLGGNVANGDPGNDMPALMQCLGAEYLLDGPQGQRAVPAREFYLGAYTTALAPGELLTAVRITLPPRGHGWAYEKLKRKVGDYATAAAAVMLTLSGGVCETASVGLTNVAPTPLWARDAGAALVGTRLEPEAVTKAVAAAESIADPASDGHGPAEYRRKMAGVMLRRALARAAERVK